MSGCCLLRSPISSLLCAPADFLCSAGLCSRPVKPAYFREVRLICLLCGDAAFLCAAGFFQGLSLACLVGLLLFVKWGFVRWASSLLFCVAAVFFFAQLDFVQGLSLPRLVGLLFFVKLFFLVGLLICLFFVDLLGRPAAFREALLLFFPKCF